MLEGNSKIEIDVKLRPRTEDEILNFIERRG